MRSAKCPAPLALLIRRVASIHRITHTPRKQPETKDERRRRRFPTFKQLLYHVVLDAIHIGHGYASARYRGHKYSCSTFGKSRQLISLPPTQEKKIEKNMWRSRSWILQICVFSVRRVRSLDNFSHISLASFLAPQSVSFPESHKLCIPHIFKRSNPSNWLYPKLARNSQKWELLFEYFTEPSILLFPFRESICLRRFPEQVYLTYKWANI